MKLEKWMPIKGYEGIYEVSTYGRVRNVLRGRIISRVPQIRKGRKPRLTVFLHKGGRTQQLSVARLVYSHFIGELTGKIRYKSGIWKNVTVWNLEQDTATDTMRSSGKVPRVLDTRTGKVYIDRAALARHLRVNYTTVYRGMKQGGKYSRYILIKD